VNCSYFIENVSAFVDGELTPEEAKAMQAHADSCPVCHRLLLDIRQVSDRVGMLPKELEPPKELLGAAFYTRLKQNEKRRKQNRIIRWGSLAAAFIMLIGAGSWFWAGGNQANEEAMNMNGVMNNLFADMANKADNGLQFENAPTTKAPAGVEIATTHASTEGVTEAASGMTGETTQDTHPSMMEATKGQETQEEKKQEDARYWRSVQNPVGERLNQRTHRLFIDLRDETAARLLFAVLEVTPTDNATVMNPKVFSEVLESLHNAGIRFELQELVGTEGFAVSVTFGTWQE